MLPGSLRKDSPSSVQPSPCLRRPYDFKAINDEHGHLSGDDALKLVVQTLGGNAGRIDVVTRHGGEEFMVLLASAGKEGAKAFYERVREDLARRSEEELGFVLRLSTSA